MIKKHKFVILVLLVMYLVVFCYFANRRLFAYTYAIERINLVPFATLVDYVEQWQIGHVNKRSIVVNIVGNIVLLLPLGALLPPLWNRKVSLKSLILIGIVASLLIEISQFAFNRGVCDIDDVILNVLGVILGYIILKGFCKVKKIITDKRQE